MQPFSSCWFWSYLFIDTNCFDALCDNQYFLALADAVFVTMQWLKRILKQKKKKEYKLIKYNIIPVTSDSSSINSEQSNKEVSIMQVFLWKNRIDVPQHNELR